MKNSKISSEFCNIVGERLGIIRKHRGMNQHTLSVALEEKGIRLSTSSISKIENRTRKVSDIELLALSEILDVSVDCLLREEMKLQ